MKTNGKTETPFFCRAESGKLVHFLATDIDDLKDKTQEAIWKKIFNGGKIEVFDGMTCQNRIDTIDPSILNR